MDLAQRIQAKTDNGDTIIDFLVEVMTGDVCDDFKLCHRLDAARLLTRYGCNCRGPATSERSQAVDFILDNPREPSRIRSDYSSSPDTLFDEALAKKIRESTDDGATVCRFLINVMDGQLKPFGPHHRISAARELLSRGFGKHATSRRSGEDPDPIRGDATAGAVREPPSPRRSGGGRNPGEGSNGGTHPSTTQPTESEKSPNPTNQSSDDGWAAFWEKVTPILEEDDRIKAELAEQNPDHQPYKRDLSAYNQAWENSEKWFYEWKNSLDPEEYEAIAAREIAEFNAMIDTKIERRKQIKVARERREKEEAEREAQQKEAEAEAATDSDEESEPGPPTRSQHKPKLMFTLGNSMYIECGHPDCKLHDEDRNKWQGSVQYGAGPTSGHFP